MENIGRLKKQFNKNPYGIDFEPIRTNKVVAHSHSKANSKKKLIRGYITLGALLGVAGIGALVGPTIKNIYDNKVETSFAREIVNDMELSEYDLSSEYNEFSALLIQTDYLLNQENLSATDKLKLQENFATINANLGNVINYSESQIAKAFSAVSGTEVAVETRNTQSNTHFYNDIIITLKDYIDICKDKTYIYSTDLFDKMLNSSNSIKSDTLKKLFDEHIDLSMLNNGNINLKDKNTFKLVQSVFNDARNLKDISLKIDEKGNIVEEEKDLER